MIFLTSNPHSPGKISMLLAPPAAPPGIHGTPGEGWHRPKRSRKKSKTRREMRAATMGNHGKLLVFAGF